MPRYLVIPDIHQKHEVAQSIIDKECGEVDCIVLLGDYFDYYKDKVIDFHRTCRWLVEAAQKPNVIALIGNHDIAYFNKNLRGPGWSMMKQTAMIDEYRDVLRQRLFPCYGDGVVLFTHAGVADGVDLIEQQKFVRKAMFGHDFDGIQSLDLHQRDGGSTNPAGILCNRVMYNKLSDKHGFQIFGHTFSSEPVIGKNYISLDTGLRHYAIIETDLESKQLTYKGIFHV